ncbi:PIN domain-containing protein [Desulfonema limicola]|uniref:PIN domain-containing protein n=1 Tax=Desulfonema limicola TaxID=45656 RepID=A0A975B5L3_9BACT|nr:hypothetical protein [Desulfonema limicola]QTA79210.1 PIN domain-containing protein [Desulfonema limicola]
MGKALSSPVYLDANIFIYAVEGYYDFLDILTELFTMIDDGKIKAVTSELTLSETIVKPMMDNNNRLVQVYQNFIQTTDSS